MDGRQRLRYGSVHELQSSQLASSFRFYFGDYGVRGAGDYIDTGQLSPDSHNFKTLTIFLPSFIVLTVVVAFAVYEDDWETLIFSTECNVNATSNMQHVEALEILLQGLCGVHRERIRIHELCLKSGPNLGLVTSGVRLLCHLEQPEPTWTVKHVGGALRGAGAEQISVLDLPSISKGGARISVAVSSVNKMLKLHATDEAVPATPGIQLVEVTAPAVSENYAEVAAAVSSFCEYLAPLLHLSKPGVSTGVVPTAAAAAASLMSDGGGTTL
ncbi:Mediator of RNA polymerase II transcription subunit 18 [Turnera subulata]|uniref:Mediator of RNA polymerase II transcription subunit 18 n=1 Tax=Turnera subulata TaxID=218843 RepID=A0A9Q0J699_9ROSI|nr:Mediator of RNA polymerase II transcription subunit 18 [Turnera subulata]